jgi:hypothetical protein
MLIIFMQAPLVATDAQLVRWAIIAIAVVISIGLIGLFAVSYVSFSRDSEVASRYLTRVFGTGSALHLLTVLAVILSATVLSLAGQLQDGAVALLSGIAGYVLGALRSPSETTTGTNGGPRGPTESEDAP